MNFQKAVKTAAKLRMAITGPSGSGKTYTALRIATALAEGKPIALVDTEHGSASKYADLFEFDCVNMEPPFHPDNFIRLIHEAERAGYAVLVVDSISHAWSGTGGVLDIVDTETQRSQSKNSYFAWKVGTPIQNHLVDTIVQSDIHIVATMRSKQDYILAENGKGKQEPKKVGMAPVQREGMDYEFDIVMDMNTEHTGVVSKTRCPALTDPGVYSLPGEQVANILKAWLSGAPAPKREVWQTWQDKGAALAWAAAELGVPVEELEQNYQTVRGEVKPASLSDMPKMFRAWYDKVGEYKQQRQAA